MVSRRAQRVEDVLTVIVKCEPAMGQAEHAVGMGTTSGEQACAAGRASRRRIERLSEQEAALGEALEIRGRDRVTIRL